MFTVRHLAFLVHRLLEDIDPLDEPYGGIRGCGRPLVVVGGFVALLTLLLECLG